MTPIQAFTGKNPSPLLRSQMLQAPQHILDSDSLGPHLHCGVSLDTAFFSVDHTWHPNSAGLVTQAQGKFYSWPS